MSDKAEIIIKKLEVTGLIVSAHPSSAHLQAEAVRAIYKALSDAVNENDPIA